MEFNRLIYGSVVPCSDVSLFNWCGCDVFLCLQGYCLLQRKDYKISLNQRETPPPKKLMDHTC